MFSRAPDNVVFEPNCGVLQLKNSSFHAVSRGSNFNKKFRHNDVFRYVLYVATEPFSFLSQLVLNPFSIVTIEF